MSNHDNRTEQLEALAAAVMGLVRGGVVNVEGGYLDSSFAFAHEDELKEFFAALQPFVEGNE